MSEFLPINAKLPVIWYGADYNPDQWLDRPDILSEDIRLMKEAGCNVLSVGIFAWSLLEPKEGVYCFDWLDRIFDSFEANGLYINLATPSAAYPLWLAEKHPEIVRVDSHRRRLRGRTRDNYCWTSPAYRTEVGRMDAELARRYAHRQNLVLWHVGNEYGGECHCELCQNAFRNYLKNRYNDSLDAVNKAWWTSFSSHLFTDWSQIESPSPGGESSIHGLNLDWRRFVTWQACQFIENELNSIRLFSSNVPTTTNLTLGPDLDPYKIGSLFDVASWDSYPTYHSPVGNIEVAEHQALLSDLTRAIKPNRPFLLMESTPSITHSQWAKLKRPGMHKVASLLMTALGSDSVMHFQWRKGRGGLEKFHGAIIGHEGDSRPRTFQEVKALGKTLQGLSDVVGSLVQPQAAVVFDWENRWALEDARCLTGSRSYWFDFVHPHHKAFFELGVATDVISQDMPVDSYKLISAPVLYLVKPGVEEKLKQFVRNGGTLILTFWSGIVDDSDLCYLGGAPGPLRELAGIWAEEIDTLYREDTNALRPSSGNALHLEGSFPVKTYCEVIHPEGAEVLATYESDYYAGLPALTVNKYGKGKVYYLAANADATFLNPFYARVALEAQIPFAVDGILAPGLIAKRRHANGTDFLFLLNFEHEPKSFDFGSERWIKLESQEVLSGMHSIPPYGAFVLKKVSS